MLPIIGLEIHLQLNTKSKVFCACHANIWGAAPNTHVCPVCLGLPGALPVLNEQAVKDVALMALALECQISPETYFERKNYFYPDLPKGFQISQKRSPIGHDGHLSVSGKRIGIWEIHLEEDTAKSLHDGQSTLLDFNKSGIPLMEIVSAPDIHTIETLDAYAKEVRQIARTLKISDCDMEKGQMRFEANVSLRNGELKTRNAKFPNYRVEIKNLNSFKHLRDAVAYEIDRQTTLIEKGELPAQETRGWDLTRGQTFVQRTKESAHDYRYFPEPDLPPVRLDEETVKHLGSQVPELPGQQRSRLETLGLTPASAATIARDPKRLLFFEGLTELEMPVETAAKLVINRPEIMASSPPEVVAELAQEQEEKLSDTEQLAKITQTVIESNPQPVADFKGGKEAALQFLLGQVMKKTQGKADPKVAAKLLRELLAN